MLVPTSLVVALAAVGRAAPEDAEIEKARAKFDAIVRECESDRRAPHGDSLTKIVHDFLSHDAAIVRRVEAAAWRDSRHGSKTWNRHSMEIENAIRFLHEIPQRRDP